MTHQDITIVTVMTESAYIESNVRQLIAKKQILTLLVSSNQLMIFCNTLDA